MAMDIYSRVAELVADKKAKFTDENVFASTEYLRFIRRKAANIITGSFYSLRQIGFNVSNQEEKELLRGLEIQIEHDSQNREIAYAASSDSGKEHLVWLNTASELVMLQPS